MRPLALLLLLCGCSESELVATYPEQSTSYDVFITCVDGKKVPHMVGFHIPNRYLLSGETSRAEADRRALDQAIAASDQLREEISVGVYGSKYCEWDSSGKTFADADLPTTN